LLIDVNLPFEKNAYFACVYKQKCPFKMLFALFLMQAQPAKTKT